MLIESIQVVNFRAIKSETLHCEKITSLIGANNAGKSTFLAAIRIFFEKKTKPDIGDLNDKSKPIEIVATFDEILEGLEEYVIKSKQRIKCTYDPKLNKKHYEIVGFEDDNKLSETKITNSIARHFEHIYIPAVRDAADDAVQKKESVLTDLIKKLGDLDKIYEPAREEYERNLENIDSDSLIELSGKVSKNIEEIDSGIRVKIIKEKPEIPKFKFKIFENDEERVLEKMGHGTQRNFIWSSIRAIVDTGLKDETSKTTVMLLEEPELYQHPPKLFQLQSLFYKLTKDNTPIQIIYATHSPNLVDFSKIENIRLFEKTQNKKQPIIIKKVHEKDIEERLKKIRGTEHQLKKGELEKAMTGNINAGCFCSKIVLVEGLSDYMVLIDKIREKTRGLDIKPNLSEMMIIPVHAKDRLLKPAIIFGLFGIDVFLMWDCDKKMYEKTKNRDEDKERKKQNMEKIEEMNADLAKFVKDEYKDPEFNENELFQDYLSDRFACFKDKFEKKGKPIIDENELDELVWKILEFTTNKTRDELIRS